MTRRFDESLVRFAIVGIANTMVGLAIIWAAKWLTGVGDVTANIIGYAFGVLISFKLNKSWTFGYNGSTGVSLVRFLVALGIAYMMNLITVIAALGLGVNGYIAQALGILPYTAFTYFASKLFVFPKDTSIGSSNAR